jgi:hypothetical protein
VVVDANLFGRVKAKVGGRLDSRANKLLAQALRKGLQSSSQTVRTGVGEAYIAVAESQGWRCVNFAAGVKVPKGKRRSLQRVGCAFFAQVKRPIFITSGTRSVHEQAVALDKKIRAGDNRLGVYKNRSAANELLSAWKRAGSQGVKAQVAAIEKVLRDQMARGIFVSQHLKAGAVDVRSIDMGGGQKKALRVAAKTVDGLRMIEEKKPPHFHLELP